MRNIFKFTALCIFALLITSGAFAKEQYRGFWVDAFNKGLMNKQECVKMVQDIRDANCNVIYLEVRKYCDAYYNSKFEPRATDIAADFDPLKTVIDLCHDTSNGKEYIEVHAWLVTYRCKIEGMKVPAGEPKHITIAHPEWISQDIKGEKNNENRLYLDQGIPGVIDHTVNVVMDIVNNYNVDGIHFDYIRYSEKTDDQGNNLWGYNPLTVARFNKIYKKEGQPKPGDPDWTSFRQRQISDMLRKVYANVKAAKPKVKVSAATVNWGDLKEGFKESAPYKNTLQNWPQWMEKGLLDQNCIMNYKKKTHEGDFKDWTKLTVDSKNGRHAIIGLGAYFNPLDYTLWQTEYCNNLDGVDGIIFFSYAMTSTDKKNQSELLKALKAGPFQKKAEIPKADWIENPKTGIVMGTITVEGSAADGAAVVTDKGQELRTDGTGFYAFIDLEPDKYKVSLIFSDKQFELGEIDLKAGSVKKLNYNVKQK